MARPIMTAAHREAVLEAAEASSRLVPLDLRSKFVLIGSGAMTYHGSAGRVGDLDFVAPVEAHGAFLDAARKDERWSVAADGVFVMYTAVLGAGAGLCIAVDLVELGGEACPSLICEPVAFSDVYAAALPDLWRMKARAFVVTRPNEKPSDFYDFE